MQVKGLKMADEDKIKSADGKKRVLQNLMEFYGQNTTIIESKRMKG